MRFLVACALLAFSACGGPAGAPSSTGDQADGQGLGGLYKATAEIPVDGFVALELSPSKDGLTGTFRAAFGDCFPPGSECPQAAFGRFAFEAAAVDAGVLRDVTFIMDHERIVYGSTLTLLTGVEHTLHEVLDPSMASGTIEISRDPSVPEPMRRVDAVADRGCSNEEIRTAQAACRSGCQAQPSCQGSNGVHACRYNDVFGLDADCALY
jgi:hypothetical protein